MKLFSRDVLYSRYYVSDFYLTYLLRPLKEPSPFYRHSSFDLCCCTWTSDPDLTPESSLAFSQRPYTKPDCQDLSAIRSPARLQVTLLSASPHVDQWEFTLEREYFQLLITKVVIFNILQLYSLTITHILTKYI